MAVLHHYQVDHLFLLVGTNPLPNFVAARLLLRDPQQSNVYFIYSDDTNEPRQTLEKVLKQHGYARFTDVKVEEANPDHIRNRVTEYAKGVSGKIGLNYTGGTKAMSVHAYLALETLTRPGDNDRNSPVLAHVQYSYLDARMLRLIIEGTNLSRVTPISVGILVQLTLDDMLALHGRVVSLKRDLIWSHAAETLVHVYSDKDYQKIWQRWVGRTFFREPVWQMFESSVLAERDALWQEWIRSTFVYEEYKRRVWKTKTELEKTAFTLPVEVAAVGAALLHETGLQEPVNMRAIMRQSPFRDADDFGKWFDGTWLETYVLQQIQQLQCEGQYHIHDAARDIQAKREIRLDNEERSRPQQVQLDVAFLRGYQLFVLSCTASSDKDRCKPRLLEAVVRAEQIGGAEARVGLVCCSDEPTTLANEVTDVLGKRVQVFGRQHLRDLRQHLANWIVDVSPPE